jgi:NTE family protein
LLDSRFFDPLNTWHIYDNKPLKESLEKFAKFPISTSFEKDEPRLLLVAVDVCMFDSYEKEDGTRKSEYGRYGRMKSDGSAKNQDNEAFEHIIRYEDGIKSDFVLASCSVPVYYDYTRLNVEIRALAVEGQGDDTAIEGSNRPTYSYSNTTLSSFWDGGLLANTPLRQTYIAHIDYWRRVRKLEDNIPSLRFNIINLHPAKQEYLPTDYDGVVDRKNDIIYHDRTEFDENIAVLMSDLVTLANFLIKLAKEKGAS